ncbi:uncharacterized protein FRV6_16486 [Fusarium oxysporum]|uniref:Uncharacterized protein n=1 Tax=Fusarium oxysporum TaxID=5507 RepID=A0A2H3TUR8_FUSOX|nr:uncharacterized protein FRV6_16486 [Fusarium oxysporum]
MATMGWFTAGGWNSAPPYQLGLRPNLCIPYAPQSTSLPCQLASGKDFYLDTAYTVWCHRVGQVLSTCDRGHCPAGHCGHNFVFNPFSDNSETCQAIIEGQ